MNRTLKKSMIDVDMTQRERVLGESLGDKILEGCEFHDNISQVYIRTTEDKLRNNLRDVEDAYVTKYAWTVPLGLFISFLATLVTTTFTDKFGCRKSVWEALFLFMCVGSLVWFLISGCKALIGRTETNLQVIMDRIKNGVQH